MDTATVSVLLPVFNGERHLAAAIDSILGQTYTEFELVIVNDGSTDGSRKIAESFRDARIRIVDQENRGVVGALNRGLAEARGRYIARQDADDLSLPNRFAREVEFLERNPDVDIVGTSMDVIDANGRLLYTAHARCLDLDIRRALWLENPFGHGTVMIRREAIEKAGGYRTDFPHAEDFDLWVRILDGGRGANLPEVLYRWRSSLSGVSHRESTLQTSETQRLVESLWRKREPPVARLRDLRASAKACRRLSARPKPDVCERFLRDQYLLGVALLRRRRLRRGCATLLRAAVVDPLAAARKLWLRVVHLKGRE